MRFEDLIKDIPDYKRFYKVDEMDEHSRQLAEKYPDKVRMYEAGKSRKGYPINVLEIGNGSKNALLFGCPHPNEPIGAMMLEYFSERLATDDELLNYFDYTWHIIKVIDIDGTKLNEGWFDDSSSIRNYAQGFYRPPGFEQVEWTFPVDYKTLHFDSPMPETQVLMKLMEDKKPDFMFSLHNAGFGGVYYYITEDSPAMYPIFDRLPKLVNLPLSLGEPEAPYLKTLHPAVYELSPITADYDYIDANSDKDPASIIKSGACSDEYAGRVADTYSIVCEMPYYYDPRIEDLSDSDITRREARLFSNDKAFEHHKFLTEMLDEIREDADKSSPFYSAINNFVETSGGYLEAERKEIETNPEMDRPATVAEVFDNKLVAQFYQSLMLGMLNRLIDGSLKLKDSQALSNAKEKAKKAFEDKISYLEENLNYKTIPIKDLVTVQLMAGLYTADFVQKGRK